MNSYQLTLEPPAASDYIQLREQCGMGYKTLGHSQQALQGSLLTVSVYDADSLIAFGRIVGDGAITFMVSDVMTAPAYRRQGLADRILTVMDRYFEHHASQDSFIGLIANKPADQLYARHHFTYLGPNRCGMLRL
ncbi:GNAT family N-acetyltransferase [Oscillospiraceae bacterium HV4-5-C5C]|nr:GNAT family N-acetyltransferase [Oscillospiraceae bacterium HV4-5-C5C]